MTQFQHQETCHYRMRLTNPDANFETIPWENFNARIDSDEVNQAANSLFYISEWDYYCTNGRLRQREPSFFNKVRSILHINRQIRAEALPMFYHLNTFYFGYRPLAGRDLWLGEHQIHSPHLPEWVTLRSPLQPECVTLLSPLESRRHQGGAAAYGYRGSHMSQM